MALNSRSPRHVRGKRNRSRVRSHSNLRQNRTSDLRSNAPFAVQRLSAPNRRPNSADILSLQQIAGNRAVQRFLIQRQDIYEGEAREDIYEGESGEQKQIPSVIGYVGMNPKAMKEAASLDRSAVDKVITSLNSPTAEKGFDTGEKRMAWVMKLLDKNPVDFYEEFAPVWHALEEADPAFREQMGDMLKLFAGAEKGEYRLKRLVMSGHSHGFEIYGESGLGRKTGTFFIERDFNNLVKAFPKAAAQVEDIMFSACNTIGAIIHCQDLFPNLQSAWAYSGRSPRIDQGSPAHIASFEKKTRGESTPAASDKIGNSVIWTKQDGFVVGDPEEAKVSYLVNQVITRKEEAIKMKQGHIPLNQAFLKKYYGICQSLAEHPGYRPEGRKKAQVAMDNIVRLLNWDNIMAKFEEKYAADMEVAYKEIGLKRPNLEGMSRPALKEHLKIYMDLMNEAPAPAAKKFFLEKLLEGLWKLDKSVIPDDWCQ